MEVKTRRRSQRNKFGEKFTVFFSPDTNMSTLHHDDISAMGGDDLIPIFYSLDRDFLYYGNNHLDPSEVFAIKQLCVELGVNNDILDKVQVNEKGNTLVIPGICLLCGGKTDEGNMHDHHSIVAMDGGGEDKYNLMSICGRCHGTTHYGPLSLAEGTILFYLHYAFWGEARAKMAVTKRHKDRDITDDIFIKFRYIVYKNKEWTLWNQMVYSASSRDEHIKRFFGYRTNLAFYYAKGLIALDIFNYFVDGEFSM